MPIDDLGSLFWERNTVTPNYAYGLNFTAGYIFQDLWQKRHSARSVQVGLEKIRQSGETSCYKNAAKVLVVAQTCLYSKINELSPYCATSS